MNDADQNADHLPTFAKASVGRRGSPRRSDPRVGQRSGSGSGSAVSGFTLVETIVSAGIFGILLLIVVGVFTRFAFVQRKDISEQAMQEDVRFAFEILEREIRNGWGSTYQLVGSTGGQLLFRNQNGLCVSYRLNSATHQLERAERDDPSDDCSDVPFAPGSLSVVFAPVTSSIVRIDSLRFDPQRAEDTDGDDQLDRQGFVTFMATITNERNASASPLTIQSTVTSRNIIPFSN